MQHTQNNSSHLIQGSAEWLEFRNTKIGSSDAPCIMGVGFDTPYQRWQQKLGLVEKPQSFAMKRGLDLEPIARSEFEKQLNVDVFPQVVINPKYEWQMASLDGLDIDRKIAVEIKCAGQEDHALALSGIVPEKYVPQLQHQMIVLNLKVMYYFSFDGSKGKILEVERDEQYCQELFDKENKFYKSLLNFEAPELTSRDYNKKTDSDWLAMANNWLNVRAKIEILEQEEENYRNALINMADKQSAEGAGIRLQKVYRKGNVDYSKVPELSGVDLERYRKRGSESFRITEVK